METETEARVSAGERRQWTHDLQPTARVRGETSYKEFDRATANSWDLIDTFKWQSDTSYSLFKILVCICGSWPFCRFVFLFRFGCQGRCLLQEWHPRLYEGDVRLHKSCQKRGDYNELLIPEGKKTWKYSPEPPLKGGERRERDLKQKKGLTDRRVTECHL